MLQVSKEKRLILVTLCQRSVNKCHTLTCSCDSARSCNVAWIFRINEMGTRSSNSSAGVYRLSILIICKWNETQVNNYVNLAFSYNVACLVLAQNFHVDIDIYHHCVYSISWYVSHTVISKVNIQRKKGLSEVGSEGVNWIQLAQDMVQGQISPNMELDIWVSLKKWVS